MSLKWELWHFSSNLIVTFFEWHYCDLIVTFLVILWPFYDLYDLFMNETIQHLIVTFLWTTLSRSQLWTTFYDMTSRSNCDLFMKDNFSSTFMTFLWMTLSRSNCDNFWITKHYYLDLIVTFLWMTLSRSKLWPFYEQHYLDLNCDLYDLFMNDTRSKLWPFYECHYLDLNCDLFMNDTI